MVQAACVCQMSLSDKNVEVRICKTRQRALSSKTRGCINMQLNGCTNNESSDLHKNNIHYS
jgi:hypothetical protein